jgi:hypothetical protein
MQSEKHCYETVASGCPAEYDSKVYQQLIHCHHSNRRVSDCSQPCSEVIICKQCSGVQLNNDVTGASDRVNCCRISAETFVPIASSQAKRFRQDAEYLEIVASDGDDSGACDDNKPSSYHFNCGNQQDNDYIQVVADDDHLQRVALDFRYYGACLKEQ